MERILLYISEAILFFLGWYGDSLDRSGQGKAPSCCWIAMPPTEAAVRRAGALVAIAAASALTRLPAAEHAALALLLHAVFLLGCAAVQLAPAHRAVASLARRAAEAARGMARGASSAARMRWAGFAGIVLLCPLLVAGDVRTEAAALDRVEDFVLYLMFLEGVWAIHLSMVTGRGTPPPPPLAAVAAEGEKLDGGEVNGVAPQSARALV